MSRFRRPTWRNGYTQAMILPTNKDLRIFLRLCRAQATKATSPKQNYVMMHLQHPDQRSNLMLFLGNLLGPRVLHAFGKEMRHLLPPLRPRCNFIHPRQPSPFPERLKLPFSSEEILSGFEEIVSSGTDQFTAWVKTDPHATLVRHMVDVQKATADFCEASERRHDTPSQTNRFNKSISNRSPVQKRLSIYNWNPGPRRGKEDAFEKQIAGRRHVITLQEASEYVDHDIPTGRLHVTHCGGCAILFNMDTFYPDVDVKSIYLHDTRRDLPDQVIEGEQGWVMQGILSPTSFRRPPLSGQESFTVLSLHISHIHAKKRGIAKKLILTNRAIMIGQQIDVVAGDFNGTAWRCSNRDNISTIDEAFADCALPTPPGPTPL